MPQLHLPDRHTDADIVLAGQIADLVGSGELYVTWTHAGGAGALPTVSAELREPLTPAGEVLALLIGCALGVWRAFTQGAPQRERLEPSR